MTDHVIVLVDGRCTLCKGWTRFLAERDAHDVLRFASQQSDVGRQLLREHERLDVVGESVVVVTSGVVYTGSRAAIMAVGMLPYPWRLVRACRVIPWFVRDWVYYFVARHRTAWYGREDEDFCEVPSEALQDKVLR